jgi:hypothetical protein
LAPQKEGQKPADLKSRVSSRPAKTCPLSGSKSQDGENTGGNIVFFLVIIEKESECHLRPAEGEASAISAA